ncbi:class I SAM-dependent methyltransferase [Bradyrhizobium sp. LHD-71]|uniref:class I SAM-dependent methyltransferase n=1 Tax=Bradyrhizobium sp. LHD-71 TaxID=3072141 RepID=UPI00280DC78F|nr:class I SAM-dependent methyltransferase [Bradyrhizobium sp. LHD-71]MDQ8726908.1 class I SAM-dependent methyltransferase [Bradyrhizobium sp. LHD-71]
MSNGWDESAAAWIADQGERGDFSREFVLDTVMLKRIEGRDFKTALDVGCGEGRFCRMLRARGIAVTGVDPTCALLQKARELDPEGDYREGRAETLEFADQSFDLVVSYLTLIDMPDIRRAIPQMVRILKPGGSLLIANVNSFISSCAHLGWVRDADGVHLHYPVDDYLDERSANVSWRGIQIENWHRPLSVYMKLLLEQHLQLVYFDEPAPHGGDAERARRYRRAPWHLVMEWRKG